MTIEEVAPLADRGDAVEEEVQHDLLHPVGIGGDNDALGRLADAELDLLLPVGVRAILDGVFDEEPWGDGSDIQGLGPGVVQEVLDDGDELADLDEHLLEDLVPRIAGRSVLGDDLQGPLDPGQRVADLVGQPRGQLAEGGQVLRFLHAPPVERLDLGVGLAQSPTIVLKLFPRLPISSSF